MRTTLLALISLLCVSSAQGAWQDTNDRFWQALASRDRDAIRSLLSGSVYDEERSSVLEVLSAFDAVSISEIHFDSLRENPDAALVAVTVTGRGHLRGGASA